MFLFAFRKPEEKNVKTERQKRQNPKMLGTIRKTLESVGLEDTVLEAGGLERQLRVFRLPDENPHREVDHELRIRLKPNCDNPLWICVTTEDGFQAWSSPVFVFQ